MRWIIVTLCLAMACAWSLAQSHAASNRGTAIEKSTGQRIEYAIVDGYAVMDDIVIGRVDDIERQGFVVMPRPLSIDDMFAKEARIAGTRRWPGTVPYKIDPLLSAAVMQAISDAIVHYHAYTPIRFVPRTTEANYILFSPLPAASEAQVCGDSAIGMVGGEQRLRLNGSSQNCAVNLKGATIHEIMHALGFGHEHQRPDRDRYVTINSACLQTDPLSQFNLLATVPTIPFGAYDYASIMHYQKGVFSVNPRSCPTMIPTQPVEIANPICNARPVTVVTDIGQRCALSLGDVRSLDFFYAPVVSLVSTAKVQVVEFYHAGFDHYFITAAIDEIAALDGGAFGGVWTRTGKTFNAYAQPWSAAAPVCRFFSVAFSPRSSHFYTSDPVECAVVAQDASWKSEGIAFAIGTLAAGACPAGTNAIYRLYNNGQGGAPNHRYAADAAARAEMLGQGWVAEASNAAGVTFCAPL